VPGEMRKSFCRPAYNNPDKLNAINVLIQIFRKLKQSKSYNALGNYLQIPTGAGKYMAYDFKLGEFATNYKFNIQTAHSSLKILEQEGYIELTDELNNPSKVIL